MTAIPRRAESFHEIEIGPVDLARRRWHDVRVPRPRTWLTLLAFVLALGAFAHRADAQAFKPRSKTGIPKRPAAATTTAAATPATTPAAPAAKPPARTAPAATPRKAPRPVAAKKGAAKKGGDDDDVIVVDDADDE